MSILDIFKKKRKDDELFEENPTFEEPQDTDIQQDELGPRPKFDDNFGRTDNISPFRDNMNSSSTDMQLVLTKLDLINQRLEVIDRRLQVIEEIAKDNK